LILLVVLEDSRWNFPIDGKMDKHLAKFFFLRRGRTTSSTWVPTIKLPNLAMVSHLHMRKT